jgi:hypothetical protein
MGAWMPVLGSGFGLAEVGVVAGDPVVAGWGEDIEVDGVFESFGGMGEMGGDDEDFAGANDGFLLVAFFAEEEAHGAGFDEGDLLVVVGMAGDEAAFFELDAGEHGGGAGDELAIEERVHGLGRDVGPSGVGEGFGHEMRVIGMGECGSGWWLVVSG